MLPQLSKFVTYSEPDYEYFCKLKNMVKNENIFVLSDAYSSDIQQGIIERANCVIGARYHSIVFAINNKIPFISLSYEHKMTGLLELLNLTHREINIENLGNKNFNIKESITNIQKMYSIEYDEAEEAQSKARKIAVDTFEALKNTCKNL